MSAGVLLPPGPEALLPGAPADGPPANGPPADGSGDILPAGPPAAGAIPLPDGPPADGAIPIPDDGPPAIGEEEPGVLVDGPFATGDIAGATDPPVAGAGGDAVEPEGVGDEVGDLPAGVDTGAPLGDDAPGVDDPAGALAEGADGVPGVDDPLGGEAAGEEPPVDGGEPVGDGVVDPLLGGATPGAGVCGGLPWFLTEITIICNFWPLSQLSLLPLIK